MTDKTYQIVVSGQLAAGVVLAEVKEKVANLFKVPAAKLEPLFSGQRVVVKKGLDQAAAHRYVGALQEAGLLSVAETLTDDGPSVTRPQANQPPSLAPVGVTLVETVPVAAPDIDISAYSMSPAGTTLIKPEPIPALEIDVSALSVSPVGVNLAQAAPVPVPDIDVSALSMASPGTRLVEAPAVPPPAIDTSAFDLAPVGSDVDQQEPGEAPPPPDTSHLKLV